MRRRFWCQRQRRQGFSWRRASPLLRVATLQLVLVTLTGCRVRTDSRPDLHSRDDWHMKRQMQQQRLIGGENWRKQRFNSNCPELLLNNISAMPTIMAEHPLSFGEPRSWHAKVLVCAKGSLAKDYDAEAGVRVAT